jgi:hypothetical protein
VVGHVKVINILLDYCPRQEDSGPWSYDAYVGETGE